MKKSIISIFTIALALAISVQAQISTPSPSPSATIIQKIGLIEAKIEYSRPSMKGRKIFGDLIPMDKIWRTGANSPTKITFSDSVTIGGKKIGGGSYALYTIPSSAAWTVILSKNASAGAGDYKEGDEAVKFTAPFVLSPIAVETFTLGFANVTTNASDITLTWENTNVKFAVTTEHDAKIMAEIKKKIENTDTYWNAANYYYDNNKDLKTALEYSNKVIEKNPQFWTQHLKAKILVKLNDCAGAVEAAKKSIELATAAKNDDYIKMNTKLIESCPVPAATPSKKK